MTFTIWFGIGLASVLLFWFCDGYFGKRYPKEWGPVSNVTVGNLLLSIGAVLVGPVAAGCVFILMIVWVCIMIEKHNFFDIVLFKRK